MKRNTRQRKKAMENLKNFTSPQDNWLADRMAQIVLQGKSALDSVSKELGRMLVESIMLMEREEISGPDYRPSNPLIQKWASEGGSVYIGGEKIKVDRPRLRGPQGEIPLESYTLLKSPETFSNELLERTLKGISTQKYEETLLGTAKAFGVSPSSVSRRLVEATTRQLKEFRERDLSDFKPFALYLDSIHRNGSAFIVALGIDLAGNKMALGFWEGNSENAEICNELLADLEKRGLVIPKRTIWITDGGKGIIKCLKEKIGKKLLHVRCMIHKSRNIQKHLAKKYRKEAHRQLKTALEQERYNDARGMLRDFEKWLRSINASAADSLLEAFDELLTLHRLGISSVLRKVLWTTNPIESMFSRVRSCEHNIKRYRGSKMAQRWLGSVLLHAEKSFRKIKGYAEIPLVVKRIEKDDKNTTKRTKKMKKAA